MRVKAWMAACAAAMVCASANGAGAKIITLTFEGTVAADATHAAIDNEGLFGAAGASLVGDAFTAIVKYDDAVGLVTNTPGSNWAIGGTYNHVLNPILQSSLTVNGVTAYRQYVFDTSTSVENMTGPGGHYIYSIGSNQIDSFAPHADGMDLAYADINTAVAQQNEFYHQGSFSFDDGSVTGFLIIDSATADPLLPAGALPTPAPEPATWAMMLLGVGALGAAMRSGRRRDDAALAA